MPLFAFTVKRRYPKDGQVVEFEQPYMITAKDHIAAAKEVSIFADKSEVTWMSPEKMVEQTQTWTCMFIKNVSP